MLAAVVLNTGTHLIHLKQSFGFRKGAGRWGGGIQIITLYYLFVKQTALACRSAAWKNKVAFMYSRSARAHKCIFTVTHSPHAGPSCIFDDVPQAAEGDQISEAAPSLMNTQYKHFCFATVLKKMRNCKKSYV